MLLSYCNGPQKPFQCFPNLIDDRNELLKTINEKQKYIQSIKDAEISVGLPDEFSLLNSIDFRN